MPKRARRSNKKRGLIQRIIGSKLLLALTVMIVFGILGAAYVFFSKAATLSPSSSMAETPSHAGYWIVTEDGTVIPRGDAVDYGSPKAQKLSLSQPIVDIAVTTSGKGYWLLGADGGVFSYGDAAFCGTPAQTPSAKTYVAIVANPAGKCYWVVSKVGSVFSGKPASGSDNTASLIDFSRVNYQSSLGGILGLSSVGIVDADTNNVGTGLFMLDANGKIYTVGAGAKKVDDVPLHTGEQATALYGKLGWQDYLVATNLGRVVGFTDYKNVGDMYGTKLWGPVTGIQAFVQAGDMSYWLVGTDGGVFSFGGAHYYGNGFSLPPNPSTNPGPNPNPHPNPNPTPNPGGGNTYDGDKDSCPKYVMKSGDKGTCVTLAQNALLAKHYNLTASGVMDTATVNVVNTFQKDNHLTVNGTIDASTWQKLLPQTGHPTPCPAGQTGTPPNCKSSPTPTPNPNKVSCIGNGSDGFRVQVVYAYFQGEKDDYSGKLTSVKAAAIRINDELKQSAQRNGGVREFRYVTSAGNSCDVQVQKVAIKPADQSEDLGITYAKLHDNYGLNNDNRKYLIFLDHYNVINIVQPMITCGLGGYFVPTITQNGIHYIDPNFVNKLRSQGATINGQSDFEALYSSPNPLTNIAENTTGQGVFPIGNRLPSGYKFKDGTTSISCWKPFMAEGDNKPTDVQLHELMHAFGAVLPDSPHHGYHGHCWDKYDVMCYNDAQPGNPKEPPLHLDFSACPDVRANFLLDCHNDDYFAVNPAPGSYLTNHWDVASSRFLIAQ